ncbi:MAG: MerC domain-containing protein, partial [Nitrosomonadaceae bacterium]|nr:MerC domain-containing protein [Nitrosomonadaceae bacterium]
MKREQMVTDKFAIGLSLICAIHCLALPLLLIILPSMIALQLDNEIFHTLIIITVLPVSIFALT